ncbi:polysaccharide deacetylase family protein [Ferruginibacter profundus]
MAKKLVGALCAFVIIIACFSGCKKFEKEGHMQEPGVVLTFDDDRVDNWFEYLPLMDSLGVKATFYICKYNRFTADQKRKLGIIKSHGHEIAFHTTNHYNMEDYVYKSRHSIDDLMRCEVEAGLKLMNQDGFYPTTFAYPYGAHNAVFDKMLMRYFKSVRALNGTQDFSKSVVPTQHNDLLYGLGIDKSSKRSDPDIINLLQSAKNNSACVVFVVHDINTPSKFSTTLHRLMKIFAFAKENKLRYYTVSEISD